MESALNLSIKINLSSKSNNVNGLILQRVTNTEAEFYILISSSWRQSSERLPIYFQLFAFWVQGKIPVLAPLWIEWDPWTRSESLLGWSIRFPKSDAAEPSAMTLTVFTMVAAPSAWGPWQEDVEQNPSLSAVIFTQLVFTKNRLLTLLVFLHCFLLQH